MHTYTHTCIYKYITVERFLFRKKKSFMAKKISNVSHKKMTLLIVDRNTDETPVVVDENSDPTTECRSQI